MIQPSKEEKKLHLFSSSLVSDLVGKNPTIKLHRGLYDHCGGICAGPDSNAQT